MEFIKELLLGAVGLGVLSILLRYLWLKLGDYVKNTDTDIDEAIYKAFNDIAPRVLDTVELGTLEEMLRKMLQGVESLPEDTHDIERFIYKELEALKKD